MRTAHDRIRQAGRARNGDPVRNELYSRSNVGEALQYMQGGAAMNMGDKAREPIPAALAAAAFCTSKFLRS